jgi:flavorubredoxin
VPLGRQRWVDDGGSFDVGDRTLHAIRPPIFDSPTTRGLFDPTTGVYWAVDAFATPLPDPAARIADLDPGFWLDGMRTLAHGAISPWLAMVDAGKFGRSVDRVQDLDLTTIASSHSPVIDAPFIERAFTHVRELPALDPPVLPGQSILDQIVAVTSIAAS